MSANWSNAAGRLAAATVLSSNLTRTEKLYASCFGYEAVDRGEISGNLAGSWATPGMKNCNYVLMTPRPNDTYALRIVEAEPAGAFAPLTTYGWGALELAVKDVVAVHETVREHPEFTVIGPPRDITFGAPVRPMQCVGPSREVFFLTEVLEETSADSPERASTPVDQLFIAILAAPDRDRAVRHYVDRIDLEAGQTFDMEYRTLNAAFGLPQGTHQSFTMVNSAAGPILQIDQYPANASKRPVRPGMLPPGIGMISLIVPNLDDVSAEFLAPPRALREAPYDGRRTATTIGSAGEYIELIEQS